MSMRSTMLLRMFLAIFLGSISSLFVPAFWAHPALAATDPITVSSRSDTIKFPKYIDFQITANDAVSPIIKATINITMVDEIHLESHDVKIANPAQKLTLTWHEDTTGRSFAPVGANVEYYWQLQDRSGNLHTERAHFPMVDTRFSWQHLTSGPLQLNWYNHDVNFGQSVLDIASGHLKRIADKLGGTLQHPVNLWIYQTPNDFRSALPPSSYEWVGGIAFTEINQASFVVDSLLDDTLQRDMPHEITHLVFHQLISPYVQPPTWLDEGLAVYNQQYREPEMNARFNKAWNENKLLRLDDIADGFGSNSDQAYLAYAQSWQLVDYMYNTFGLSKMRALIKSLNDGGSTFTGDMRQTLGVDEIHLENQWHLSLHLPATLQSDQPVAQPTKTRSGSLVVPTDNSARIAIITGILLILLSFSILVALMFYLRRQRLSLARMQSGTVFFPSNLPSTPYPSALITPYPTRQVAMPTQPITTPQPSAFDGQQLSSASPVLTSQPVQQPVSNPIMFDSFREFSSPGLPQQPLKDQ